MVKHGALSKSHVHQMLASKDARVRRAAYTLLEASNPGLRRNSELFLEIIRFIWEANPSYDIYREFNKRHLIVPYKVHELISARLRVEKQEQQRAAADQRADEMRRHEGGFFQRLLDGVCLRFKARGARIVTPAPVFHDRDRIVARSQRVSSLSRLTYDRRPRPERRRRRIMSADRVTALAQINCPMVLSSCADQRT